MAVPKLTPASEISAIRLPITGAHAHVNSTSNPLPFGIYAGAPGNQHSFEFVSGAVDQVAYVYKKLGGDVLDVEITEYQVYAAYEEAVLEYSYIVNIHQAKNVLSDFLGNTTGTFDQDGELMAGTLSSSLAGTHAALKYPRFSFEYSKRISVGAAEEVWAGGYQTLYSASFSLSASQQDYDLQKIIAASASDDSAPYYNKVGNKKVSIKRVFYKTPATMWRFFGYYGGLSVIGNLHNYGQWADNSTFELIPAWQNKLQAMAFDDSLYTRLSHYSYEINNNKIRIHPTPGSSSPDRMWVQFYVKIDSWEEDEDRESGIRGINNMNTIPFANIPYENINSIGKQWIRRFCMALCKEMLGQIRGKFQTVPIPGESVTLNHSELIAQSKEEQEKLREELKTVLDELTYSKLVQEEATKMEAASKVQQHVPMTIFVG